MGKKHARYKAKTLAKPISIQVLLLKFKELRSYSNVGFPFCSFLVGVHCFIYSHSEHFGDVYTETIVRHSFRKVYCSSLTVCVENNFGISKHK